MKKRDFLKAFVGLAAVPFTPGIVQASRMFYRNRMRAGVLSRIPQMNEWPYRTYKTGQTTQYNGMADDGATQRGKARDFEILTTGQYSGTTNITVNGKTNALTNNCVKDHATGLMWVRDTINNDLGPSSDGLVKWYDAANREDVFGACDELNSQSHAGHTDWVVPNIQELVDNELSATPPVLATEFPNWFATDTWSSSTHATITTEALELRTAVDFMDIATVVKTAAKSCAFCRYFVKPTF